VFNYGGNLYVTNSTLAGNTAQGGRGTDGGANGLGDGGAVFNYNGILIVTNSTLSGNVASADGREVYTLGDGATATTVLNNSILGQADASQLDFIGAILNGGTSATSGGYDLIRSYAGFAGGVVSTADPRLAPPANNGGPTPTLALLPGSPARHTGSNARAVNPADGNAPLTTDQRGDPRVVNDTVDLGAFEAQG
jgi:hypothetical protein